MKGETLGATLPHLNYNLKIIGGVGWGWMGWEGGGSQKGKGFCFFAEWSVGTFIFYFLLTSLKYFELYKENPRYFVCITGHEKFINNQPI